MVVPSLRLTLRTMIKSAFFVAIATILLVANKFGTVKSFSVSPSTIIPKCSPILSGRQRHSKIMNGGLINYQSYSFRKTNNNVRYALPDDGNDSISVAATAFPDVARPEPSVLLSSQDDVKQIGGVAAIAVGILLTTALMENVLGGLNSLLGGFLLTIVQFTIPLPLGLLYIALGVTHFTYKDEYAAIVPPLGTWGGLWNIPAPGKEKAGLTYQVYHVVWTGIAEIGGGALLALGGLNALPVQIPAFLLFLLTLAITPANVYMFTHDAQMSFAPPIPYPEGHVFRGVIQCILLSLLWFLAFN